MPCDVTEQRTSIVHPVKPGYEVGSTRWRAGRKKLKGKEFISAIYAGLYFVYKGSG
jgi:hypothetical protein